MLRSMRLAALAAVVTLAFGSLAWGHDRDDDDYRDDAARHYGYQNGYREGMRHGHYDREQGYRYNFKSDQWEDARDAYDRSMGSFGHYKKAFRDGYVNGYRQGFNSYGDRRDWDHDRADHRQYDRDDWR